MRVSGGRKLWRLGHGGVVAADALRRRQAANAAPRVGLWTRTVHGMQMSRND
jgi:hypothetical protein